MAKVNGPNRRADQHPRLSLAPHTNPTLEPRREKKQGRVRPDYRGDWKIESTFSAPSLYFFSTLFFCCFSSSP